MANGGIRKLLVFVQKRFLKTSSSPPPPLIKDSKFPINFLRNSCGLSSRSAQAISEKIKLHEKNHQKLLSVIDFFRDEGFSETHIAKLIEKCPMMLHFKVEATVRPKLEFLKQNGIVGEPLTRIIVRNPTILRKSLAVCLKSRFELLKSYLNSDEIVVAVVRDPWLLTSGLTIHDCVSLLSKEGLPAGLIAKLITLHPRSIMQKPGRVIYAVNAAKKLGVQPSFPMFIHAIRVVMSMSEYTLKKKMEMLQSLGWSEEEISSTFRRCPMIMSLSENNIRRSMDFFMNTVKLDPQTIIRNPSIFTYSIDSRIRPRYIVWEILESKKLIKADKNILSFFIIGEETFLDKYVIKYKDAIPDLLEKYDTSKKAGKTGI